ncbi:uncharacterized protein MELLADRAFT_68633 [Melampsora larici-populina 98AG31]|uniref:Uncharacterized protein n=1 Tax=Melampsora larici-populina (strain 98AG31 / pathotype 3-4-7) TaxID=747676 RepID=F4S7H4_MELLP|nr:uncharacterized protein MELLADRAFT_68633 [Melampsora larici-populina 98AG31]EGF99425.1 hypothetical protein MELLADRAFT_68633 [Melampsora larici-populina 98AG31]
MLPDSSLGISGSFDSQGGGNAFHSPSTGGLNTFNTQGNVRNSNVLSFTGSYSAAPIDSPAFGDAFNSPSNLGVQRFSSQGGLRNSTCEFFHFKFHLTPGISDQLHQNQLSVRPTMPPPNSDHNRRDRPELHIRNDRSLSPNRRGASRLPERSHDCSREPLGHSPNRENQGSNEGYRWPDEDLDDAPQPFAHDLSERNMVVFDALANHCGLDDTHRHFALSHSEIYGENNRHIAGAMFHSMLLMEISRLNSKVDLLANQIATGSTIAPAPAPTPAPGAQEGQDVVTSSAADDTTHKKWKASRKLVGLINPMALKFLWSAELEAYTAISNEREGYHPKSLFNMIKKTLAGETAAFKAQHLPPQRKGVEHAADTTAYASALRDAGKQGREKLHNVLLVGIHDPKSKEIVGTPVPSIKDMVKRVSIRCGVADTSAEEEAVWKATNHETRARVAYMRREAARVICKGHKGNESVWANIDHQLSILRSKRDENYAAAFYDLVFEEDKQYFTGKTWFKTIKANQLAQNKALDLPSEEAIMARMALEDARRVSGPGTSNGGNQGTTSA